jgi:succinoglycan biosynthesis protein ExoW
MKQTIGVVIPFYQRDPQTLRKSLASVLAQRLQPHVQLKIVVVDDESPVRAEDALAGGAVEPPHTLSILRRSNGGPGAARNTGLSALEPSETEFVAFLDSDDVWYPEHLTDALEALGNEGEFYFANSQHGAVDSFHYMKFIRDRHLTSNAGEVSTISGSDAFRAFLLECAPHTSNVVYRFSRHSALRFDETLRRAGEDHLFWLALSTAAAQVSYSTRVSGERGEGVSIYRETLAWDSPRGPDRIIDEIVLRNRLLSRYALEPLQREAVLASKVERITHLLFILLRWVRKDVRVAGRALVRVTRRAPEFWYYVPEALLCLPAHARELRRAASSETTMAPNPDG